MKPSTVVQRRGFGGQKMHTHVCIEDVSLK